MWLNRPGLTHTFVFSLPCTNKRNKNKTGDLLQKYPAYIPGLADGQTPLEQERVDLTPSASALGLKPILSPESTTAGSELTLYLHAFRAPPATLLPDRVAFDKVSAGTPSEADRWHQTSVLLEIHPFTQQAPLGFISSVPLEGGVDAHLVLPPAAVKV
jgi:hypothetical protein